MPALLERIFIDYNSHRYNFVTILSIIPCIIILFQFSDLNFYNFLFRYIISSIIIINNLSMLYNIPILSFKL